MSQEKEIRRFNRFVENIFSKLPFRGVTDFTDKESAVGMHVFYMLCRTQSMFEYSGLPDTIPARMLELYLQLNGNCCISEHEGNLYAFVGGLGGEPDVYYMPTVYTIANPALQYSANLKIGKDCIVIPNDSLYIGLAPMFNRYASQMAENELSINIAIINSRIIDLIAADDDNTAASAKKFLADIKDGKLGVITDAEFADGLKALPYGTSGSAHQLTDLIETEQYLKAGWYNEIGLNANYNMKREALSTAESQLNDDALLPLIDDMLRCREIALEKVNDLYGTDISVKLASSWEDNQLELDLKQEQLEEETDPEPENDPEPNPDDDPEKGENENV